MTHPGDKARTRYARGLCGGCAEPRLPDRWHCAVCLARVRATGKRIKARKRAAARNDKVTP